MTWKREKKLVEDIIKEKYDLDKLVSELTKLKSNELLNKHIQLNLSLFNIIIFILTGILVYLMLNLFTNSE